MLTLRFLSSFLPLRTGLGGGLASSDKRSLQGLGCGGLHSSPLLCLFAHVFFDTMRLVRMRQNGCYRYRRIRDLPTETFQVFTAQ